MAETSHSPAVVRLHDPAAENTQSQPPVAVAVIGAGRLGTFHARKLAQIETAHLVGVADTQTERAQAVAQECGCVARNNYQDLLPRCDAVVVAVPTSLHYRVVKDCLQAERDVFVEKPIAATADQARVLTALAAEQNRVLQVGHIERFNPAYTTVKPLLGDICYIEVERCSPFSFRAADVGVVLDLMIHDLDLVLDLAGGTPYRVEGAGLAVLGSNEDAATVRLDFGNGAVAFLKASRIAQESIRTMHIFSRKGEATIDFAQRRANICQYGQDVQSRKLHVEELSPAELEALKPDFHQRLFPWRELDVPQQDAMESELRDFLHAVQHRLQPRVSGMDGLRAVALAETIAQTIKVLRPAQVPPEIYSDRIRRAA